MEAGKGKPKSLKEKTISGMIWSSIGRFGTMGLGFISNLVLARLLMPSDFGVIGMLHVFIAVSGVFVTAGFGSALIQKKNPTHVDYTSVFWWNLAAAIVFYWILFFCGPLIARFYEMPELCPVLRVQSLSLIIQAFSVVQTNQLRKRLRFKQLSMRSLTAAFAGAVVGITMALLGFSYWSLVASSLVASLAGVLLLWRLSSWRPTLEFSVQSLKELFAFGGLMALSALVEEVYTNLQSLIIGKWYSPKDLGYYTQARKLEDVPTLSLSHIVNQVSFPVFSSLQDDHTRLVAALRKNSRSINYINFPLMALLIVIARPLIMLLYGAKWEISIPYFQILCISSLVFSMNTLNTNIIKSLGRGKLYFWVQLIKRIIGLVLIILGARAGMMPLMWALTAIGYTSIVINMYVTGRLIGYGIGKQVRDLAGYFAATLFSAGVVYLLGLVLPFHPYLVMLVQILVFAGLYIGLSLLFKFESLYTYLDIARNYLKRLKK
jgi:O-antigen/teichoic acid export membrane protein